jgi:hypothetical protein
MLTRAADGPEGKPGANDSANLARRWIGSLALAGAVGAALATGLGAVTRPASPASIPGKEITTTFSQTRGSGGDVEATRRAQRIVADVLAAAPECEPDIRMAGAPADEREEFLRKAEQLAAEAAEEQGLHNVVWRVVERDGRLYGVLYGERCA